jgi:hypothetical protein
MWRWQSKHVVEAGDVEVIRKLWSGSPLPGGGAPVAAVDSKGSLKHKADEEDTRGKLVRWKGAWRCGSLRSGDGGGGELNSGEMGRPPIFKTDDEGSGKAAVLRQGKREKWPGHLVLRPKGGARGRGR